MLGRVLRPLARASTRPIWLAAAAAAAGLLVAACGSAPGGSGTDAAGFTAYRNCLQQHGVSLPTSRPTSGAGGFGAAGGFGGGSSTFQKASEACSSLRPSFGGFGGTGGSGGSGGFGGFATALQAFRSCMSAHGEAIPTTRPTSPPASGSSTADRFLNGLNPDNAKVAAALKACESKLPSFASG